MRRLLFALFVSSCMLLQLPVYATVPALLERVSAILSLRALKAISNLPEHLQQAIIQKIKETPKKVAETLFKNKADDTKKDILKKEVNRDDEVNKDGNDEK